MVHCGNACFCVAVIHTELFHTNSRIDTDVEAQAVFHVITINVPRLLGIYFYSLSVFAYQLKKKLYKYTLHKGKVTIYE